MTTSVIPRRPKADEGISYKKLPARWSGVLIFNAFRDYSPGVIASAGQTPAQVPQSMQMLASML